MMTPPRGRQSVKPMSREALKGAHERLLQVPGSPYGQICAGPLQSPIPRQGARTLTGRNYILSAQLHMGIKLVP